jgi:hypothetical protein
MRELLHLWLRQQAGHLFYEPKGGRPSDDYKTAAIRHLFAWKIMINPRCKLKVLRGELEERFELGKRQIAELTKDVTWETAEKIYWQSLRPQPEGWPPIWYPPVMFDVTDTGLGRVYLEEGAPKEG